MKQPWLYVKGGSNLNLILPTNLHFPVSGETSYITPPEMLILAENNHRTMIDTKRKQCVATY